ncbi:hypothetical protein [Streptomyces sp. NBC_00316]|uniref:hypothetical protein n=1 Tax=Streptomyces sp. NBC_00316 TaxID=2975710 RepID=UPI002E2D7B14|nr:hypothetical protein [Streptomyces sp. NBC_00316]
MNRFREHYGSSPLHLLLVLASFALTGYAGIRLLGGGEPLMVVVWFIGAALLHDLVLLPLYTVTDRAAQTLLGDRREPETHHNTHPPTRGWINYLRVPVFLSGILLLTYFPLILGRVDRFTAYTTLPDDVFLGRWLLITAVLFALSALVLLIRMTKSRPTPSGQAPEPGPGTGTKPGTAPGPGRGTGPEPAPESEPSPKPPPGTEPGQGPGLGQDSAP